MKKKVGLLLFIIISLKTEAQTSVFKVADSLLRIGNYQEAIKKLETEEPKTIEIYDKIAGIYQTVGNYNKAIENYNKALLIKEVVDIKSKLGKVYRAAGLPLKAIEIYEEIIQKDSTNLMVANSLGSLYLSKKKTKSARKIFEYLKEKDPLNPNYPYQLAVALGRLKKPLEMGQNYLDAYIIDSLHIKSIYRLAIFYKDLKFKDSTALFIEKGLQIDSLNINFNQLKANVLYKDKNYKEAIKHLKLLDSLNYKSVGIYEMLGMSYMNLDSLDRAEGFFKKAMKIDRMNGKINYRLATIYHAKKEYKKASMYANMSIFMLKPDIDKQYFLLGIIYKEENKLKEAINSFKKAFENNSRNYEALFELAATSDAYYKDKKIAFDWYEKYLNRFDTKDKEKSSFAKKRIKYLKKDFFIEGVKVE